MGRCLCRLTVLVESLELSHPFHPLFAGCVETISHVAQELDLHDVNLADSNAGNLGPCLVRIGIVIENCHDPH
jgi:hypothetical protein